MKKRNQLNNFMHTTAEVNWDKYVDSENMKALYARWYYSVFNVHVSTQMNKAMCEYDEEIHEE